MPDLLLSAGLAFAGLLVLAAAITDVASLTIPNRIPAALILLFPLAAVAAGLGWSAAAWHAGVAVAVLAVTVGLFAAGLFGGGDAKLMPAIALWLGPSAIMPFVFHTAVAGGVLAFLFLLVRRMPAATALAGRPWTARLLEPRGGIPYGVAIAAGTVAAAPHADLVGLLGG